MATVLVIDAEDKTTLLLKQSFDSRRTEYGEVNSITRIDSFANLQDMLVGIVFDVVLIDESFVNERPEKWMPALRKKYPNFNSPIIIMGRSDEPLRIMGFLEAGFMDYVVKPVDKPLLLEKIFLFATGTRPTDGRQVYNLRTRQLADMAKTAVITEMSEFDCKIVTRFPYMVGEILTIYSSAFSDEGKTTASVIARCYKCYPIEGSGGFEAYFSYLGVSPGTLQKIRANLRKEYAAQKGNL